MLSAEDNELLNSMQPRVYSYRQFSAGRYPVCSAASLQGNATRFWVNTLS
jgi:hypothetical protein